MTLHYPGYLLISTQAVHEFLEGFLLKYFTAAWVLFLVYTIDIDSIFDCHNFHTHMNAEGLQALYVVRTVPDSL